MGFSLQYGGFFGRINSVKPWNDWYHCTLHTYGTWLRGDPRGWRARHHREHVEGDYKHPPPKGLYEKLHGRSKSLMTRDVVEIDNRPVIEFVLYTLVRRFEQYQVPFAIGSFDGVHAHLLIQCADHNPRILVGIAKQYATAQLKAHGSAVGFDGISLKIGEGIWGKRSHATPIKTSSHYDRTHLYISDHRFFGAAVWTLPQHAELTEKDFLSDFGLLP